MRILLFLLCVLSPFAAAKAESNSDFSANVSFAAEPERVARNEGVRLYRFSPDLLNAAADCLPYSEDFTKLNPDLKALVKDLGGQDLQILIDIQGIEDNRCMLTVTSKLLGICGQKAVCALNGEQHRALVKAMNDRSKKRVVARWTTTTDDTAQMPIETTMSGGIFDVTMAKIKALACQVEDVVPTKEEVDEAKDKTDAFSPAFVAALQNCVPATADRNLYLVHDEVKIVGRQDDVCHLKYKIFDLYVPSETMQNLRGYTDVERLLKNKQISVYDYKQQYLYDGILFELEYCRKHKTKHNGLSERNNADEEADIEKGIMSEPADGLCNITFINKLYYGGHESDYSVVCAIPNDKVDAFLSQYADILQKYGEKSVGGAEGTLFEPAVHNDETRHADGLLLVDIQTLGLCRRLVEE